MPPIRYGLFLSINSKNPPANAGPIILANADDDCVIPKTQPFLSSETIFTINAITVGRNNPKPTAISIIDNTAWIISADNHMPNIPKLNTKHPKKHNNDSPKRFTKGPIKTPWTSAPQIPANANKYPFCCAPQKNVLSDHRGKVDSINANTIVTKKNNNIKYLKFGTDNA